MASLSIPSQSAGSNLFGPKLPSAHARKHSRNPSNVPRAPLPAFSFNPSSSDVENHPPELQPSSGNLTRSSRPAPLPDFKFNPGADLPAQPSPSPTHPVLEEMALNQQRVSRSARPAPLPMFTFNPGAVPQQLPSPTRSEHEDVEGYRNSVGHRRGGSEFVGGGLEGPQLVNTSPQKHESKPSGPPVSTSTYRGHNHRRSQAISVSDIDTSDLIKTHAIAKSRAGSVPTTPNTDVIQSFSFQRQSPQIRPSSMHSAVSPPNSPRRRRGSAPGIRPRVVDFADKIDVIPRPLSMISSETEESCSTVRGTHSLNNSINSIASPFVNSPPRFASTASSPSLDQSPPRRPQTADPSLILAHSEQSDLESAVQLPKRPLSASEPSSVSISGTPPTKKKHFWSTHSNESTPTTTPRSEEIDPFSNLKPFTPSAILDNCRPRTSPERSGSRIKRRKYHTWTSGIFSKKSRQRTPKTKSRRTPTPPALMRRDSEKLNEIFDADDTIVLRESSPVAVRHLPRIQTDTTVSTINPPSPTRNQLMSPVIDLDAALGESDHDEQLENHAGKTAAARIAKLHSSERRGVLDAFGVIHRRTESAPSMPAVNRAVFGMKRHGSNPSLANDVFDEEEEDIFLADQEKAKSDDGKSIEAIISPSEEATNNGLGLKNVPDSIDDVIIVDDDAEDPRDENRSSNSTIEAPMLSAEDLPKRPATSPMTFVYPTCQSHYASSTEGRTTTASLVSSPDADHISFDTQFRLRQPGASPDFVIRPSTDDLPSLSDSISSGVIPRVSSSVNTRSSTERSHSMFVPTTTKSHQNWKRASLASLNKLLPGSANGSKLKFETVPDTASEKNAKVKSKTNRLSRLMRFWKPKEDQVLQ